VAITAGNSHSCGITGDGAAYCWGRNDHGQLGDGTVANGSTPRLVSGGFTFAAISAGASVTCGVTSNGAAFCWGLNASGQLGDGSTTDSNVPVRVAGQETPAP
jgi:alpha-tubulin suppressor-like RCC1 family protein